MGGSMEFNSDLVNQVGGLAKALYKVYRENSHIKCDAEIVGSIVA